MAGVQNHHACLVPHWLARCLRQGGVEDIDIVAVPWNVNEVGSDLRYAAHAQRLAQIEKALEIALHGLDLVDPAVIGRHIRPRPHNYRTAQARAAELVLPVDRPGLCHQGHDGITGGRKHEEQFGRSRAGSQANGQRGGIDADARCPTDFARPLVQTIEHPPHQRQNNAPTGVWRIRIGCG